MKQYHQLQMRFPAEQAQPGMKFAFRGREYTLGGDVPQTLGHAVPIGVVVNGYTRQFSLVEDGGAVGQAWFYFYTSFEKKSWAVLDELELSEAVRCA